MLWWLLELSSRFGVFFPALPATIPPSWAHAYLMIYGFLPFFIFGFLLTFLPSWLDAEHIPRREYLLSFFGMGLGTGLFYAGLIFSKSILLLAVLLTLSGWGMGAVSLFRILRSTRSPEKGHLSLMVFFIFSGAAGLCSFLLWLSTNTPIWRHYSSVIGIWFFLLPLTVTVSHLVIPFFSKNALKNYRLVQPVSILCILLGGIFLRGLLEGMGMRRYFWFPDTVLLLSASYLSIVWGFWKSAEIKMLFMLHLSFVWFSVAIFLDLLQSLVFVWSHETQFILGRAPLHALTIGFFSNMVIGMSTRVTLGHFGRPVLPGNTAWRLFWVFQIVAILRILSDLFPAGSLITLAGYQSSGLLWIGGLCFWLQKYGTLLWGPVHADQ